MEFNTTPEARYMVMIDGRPLGIRAGEIYPSDGQKLEARKLG